MRSKLAEMSPHPDLFRKRKEEKFRKRQEEKRKVPAHCDSPVFRPALHRRRPCIHTERKLRIPAPR
jgi:hypothetical protein